MSKKTNELDSFDEQSFMIRLLPYFSKLKGEKVYEGYENIEILPDDTDNITFLADLDSEKKDKFERFNLTERLPKEVLTSLNPSVKIYKVFYRGENDKKGVLAQFPFNNMKSGTKITDSRYQGSTPGQLAVGLKEFSFDYLGTHPGEVDTFIDCNLKLYFSSVEALFQEYTYTDKDVPTDGTGPTLIDRKKFSFLDLIKRPKKLITGPDNKVYNEKYFRIRVDVGYENPDRKSIQEAVRGIPMASGFTKKGYVNAIMKEIENTKVSFFLNLQRHTLTPLFDTPSGAFEMNLTFNASVESAFTSKSSNILLSGMTGADISKLENDPIYKRFENAKKAVTRAFDGDEAIVPVLETLKWADFFNENYIHRFYGGDLGGAVQRGKHPYYLVRPNTAAFKKLLAVDVPTDFYESLSSTEDLLSRDPQELMKKVFGEFQDPKTKHLFNYFVRRKVLEDFKTASGLSAKEKRIAAYNRLIRDLITPPENYRARGHQEMPIKVYRTDVTRALIREYNNKLFATKLTEDEQEAVKEETREGSGKFAKRRADSARQARKGRRDSLIKFLNRLQTGENFGSPSTIGGSLGSQLSEYYKQVEDKVRGDTKEDEEKEMPVFAISKPKIDDSDPGGLVDLRWVYFGDLIDTGIDILKSAYNELNEELAIDLWHRTDDEGIHGKFHIAMGTFEFTDTNGVLHNYNLARFPIPFRSVVDFWTKKVVEKNRETYLLRSFIRDALVELVANPLNATSRSNAPKESYKPHYEVLSIPKSNSAKLETTFPYKYMPNNAYIDRSGVGGENLGRSPFAAANYASVGGPNKKVGQEILFLGLQKNDQKSLFANDRKKDIKKGIFYLGLKREGSAVFDISFSRSDQQYLMEARAEKGLLDEVTQLSEVYNCTFTSVGNTTLKPGRFVYITDPHFGDVNTFFKNAKGKTSDVLKEMIYTRQHASMLLGIGGYFLIIKAKHRLKAVNSRLVWQTTADCHWNSFGKGLQNVIKRQEDKEVKILNESQKNTNTFNESDPSNPS